MPYANVPLVPKDPRGPLRVLIIGRISTPHQDIANIDASYRYVEDYLKQVYQGPLHIKHLGEQASGMRTDRATIVEADEEIETGTWDLVIAEDLSRFYRNPRHQYAFVQDAVDRETRDICIGDNLDTAEDNWEVALGSAALRHGLYIPDTRRRVRRKAADAFRKGGMVQKVRFGYRKLSAEQAATGEFGPKGLRIAKRPECTPVFQEMKRRVLEGAPYAAVADWLNEEGVSPGPYVINGRWRAKLVDNLLRDPILHGTRTFGDIRSQPLFRTGKRKRRKNPNGPDTEHYPELAHFSVEEHEALLRVMDDRAEAHRSAAGADHPLYNRPRSRSIWPGQHPRCAICGGLMYRYDDDQLKCANTFKRPGEACWNRVQMSCQATRDKVLTWLVNYCEQVPEFRRALADAAWAELEAQRRRAEQSDKTIDHEIKELEKRVANLAHAIAAGGPLDALVRELSQTDQTLKAANARRKEQAGSDATHKDLTTRADVEARLGVALREVARSSFEFADLMRRVIPEFVIQPVQALDSGQVRPRAKLTVDLGALMGKPGGGPDPYPRPETVRATLDLFDPPAPIREMRRCLAWKAAEPRLSLKKLASRLGLSQMTVKRALDYARRMEREGLLDPYREVHKRPESASRWSLRRNDVTTSIET